MIIDLRGQFTLPQGHATNAAGGIVGVAVHHSVTANLAPTASEAEELAALKSIETYHTSIGYGLFAYHFATFPGGRAYRIGDTLGRRAHVAQRNHELVGVVNIGTFTDSMPAAPQFEATRECIAEVERELGRTLRVSGHNNWALPGQGTACAGAPMNALTSDQWHAPVAGATGDGLHRWLGLANPAHFNGLALDGELKVWTRSPVAGDLQGIPDEARALEVCVYLVSGELDLLDGDGQKAGFCSGRHTHYLVRRADDERRTIGLRGTAVIDKIEVLGWYA